LDVRKTVVMIVTMISTAITGKQSLYHTTTPITALTMMEQKIVS
jgi:hypothetical protein